MLETFNRTNGVLHPDCRSWKTLFVELASLLTHKRGRNLFLPAHGRGEALPMDLKTILRKSPGLWDLPELPDIGSPLESFGALEKSQRISADLFGAEKAWYGVNGATGLLQAALFAMLKPGEAVLMPRNVHKSLINACLLGDFIPVLFDLPFMVDRGHFSPPDQSWLKTVLLEINSKNIRISAAVLVNPTYHGYSIDLTALINILHDYGLPVLIDEAHGAHFSICDSNGLPKSALASGADLVVNSLHKSSVGLCQTAVLWSQGKRVDHISIKRAIECVQTSSPSSLLLASCEIALREWKSPLLIKRIKLRIKEARDLAIQLREIGLPFLINQDPLRLILHTASIGISGIEADNWFISRGLIAELPEPGCLTFCLGFSSHKGLQRTFRRLWRKLESEFPGSRCFKPFTPPPLPLISLPFMNSSLAWRSHSTEVLLEESVGRVSAEMICPYPPGIPLLIPGEIFNQSRVNWLVEQRHFCPEQIPAKVRIVN